MKKIVKIGAGLLVMLALIFVGLSVFVRFYLTPERLKDLIIPLAEKATGRQIGLDEIKVGLFSGIQIKGFRLKEADGQKDFVRIREFVLRYHLLPLLQKKLVIGEVRLVEPQVRLVRDKKGHFNFETLAFLKEAPQEGKKAEKAREKAPGLPLALVVDRIKVESAQVFLVDQMNELPTARGQADINIALSLGQDPSSIKYEGDYSFLLNLRYGELTPTIKGQGQFNQQRLDYQAKVNLAQEEVDLKGWVKDYLAPSPTFRLDLSSQTLNLDHLLAAAALVPKSSPKGKRSGPGAAPDRKEAFPDIQASGQVEIARLLYQKLALEDFRASWHLKGGALKVRDFSAKMAQGLIQGGIQLDLNDPRLGYKGEIDVSDLKLGDFISQALAIPSPPITGLFRSRLVFSGRGTEWASIKRSLSADGDYGLLHGAFKESLVTLAISQALGLEDLRTLSFREIKGNVRIRRGRVETEALLTSDYLSLKAKGFIGLDGSLDLPLKIKLFAPLAEKFARRLPGGKYLLNEKGEAELDLYLKGSLSGPRVSLDTRAIEKKLKKELPQRLFQKLGIPWR